MSVICDLQQNFNTKNKHQVNEAYQLSIYAIQIKTYTTKLRNN